jgi:hypothetical protein
VITKPEEHDINRAGKRLLREVLEPLNWVVNDVQEDYGIDSNVQVFDGKFPTGAWFHIQLKSSASSAYSSDRTFISQELSIDHARHYTIEMRDPVLIIHADVTSATVCWYAPQLDRQLAIVLGKTEAKSITVKIPTSQQLPGTAPGLLSSLNEIYLTLASRELTSASIRSFAESLRHLPDQQALYRAFHEKNDTLKLQKIIELFQQRKFKEARPRAQAILDDPDSTTEVKFWAEVQIHAIDHTETVHAGKPQSELPKLALTHAKVLQKLTVSGPKHLKFYSLIARQSAELGILVQQNYGSFLTMQQHIQNRGDPMMALGLYARRSVLTRRIVSRYNRCLRLTRYAANYPDRWVLGRALITIVNWIGPYLITLHAEKNFEVEHAFAQSALQICKLGAWIGQETGDPTGVVVAIIGALLLARSEDTEAYRWADQMARSIREPEIREDALVRLERAKKRWKGEQVEGDYYGDTTWQIIQNMATALGIDLSDENDPLVRGLRIAAKDNSPERILVNCEHLLVSQGAIGPIARKIKTLFNLGTAGSKVVHCTLHNYHREGAEQDTAYGEFRRLHCDSCPDKKPRPDAWEYTDDVRQEMETRNSEFVARLAGTEHGIRFTNDD